MPKTLMEKLAENGYPEEEMFGHYSDLHVYATPLTKRVIDEWLEEQGFEKGLFVSKFTDQITGRTMYEVFFQYTPYWERMAQKQ